MAGRGKDGRDENSRGQKTSTRDQHQDSGTGLTVEKTKGKQGGGETRRRQAGRSAEMNAETAGASSCYLVYARVS
eukprot:753108-Hanusia_phi.AAC.2